jgi:hypothetical protein
MHSMHAYVLAVVQDCCELVMQGMGLCIACGCTGTGCCGTSTARSCMPSSQAMVRCTAHPLCIITHLFAALLHTLQG